MVQIKNFVKKSSLQKVPIISLPDQRGANVVGI